MLSYFYISMFMFMSGIMVFSFQRKHFLVVLLSLEFLVISIFLMMSMNLSLLNNEFFFLMLFLTMSVCEGALGLSILVSLIRAFGNDNILMFFILW
uniref:NADH-ubiquinone oxidoreductase chain 4L n=1 Tax=Anthribidae sp. 6 ACP-2013 TaxID=1434433 RepID=A0A3G5FNA4_9CUCU|nr:NADH dehydrogenase subunit 4L [Anthribidae sp. 6 ACP-2013]